jgi:hypothetical protein
MAVLLGAVGSSKNRFYVDNSMYFDNHEYNVKKITKIVKENGGYNVRLANLYGYSNLPKVVTFTLDDPQDSYLLEALKQGFKTRNIYIRKKDF